MKEIYVFACISLFVSCSIFDKDETVPGFVVITSADVQTNVTTQGASTSDIRDVVVSANGQYVGTYDIPATIPILQNGPATIRVSAGIRNNGLSADRQAYPFYAQFVTEVELIPALKTPLSIDSSITFQYFSTGLAFEIEDFENTGISLLEVGPNNAEFQQITSPLANVKSGTTSLEVILTPDSNHFEAITNFELLDLPKGNNMYLEIDFKGEIPLEIGIIAIGSSVTKIFALGLLPQTEWTKVYVELTDEISRQIAVENFEIYFESNLPEGIGERRLYLDNIKFVYPQ